jgi:hypothetical protein
MCGSSGSEVRADDCSSFDLTAAAERADQRGAAVATPRRLDPLLIYGANGFVRQRVAHAARAGGVPTVVAGRDARKLRPI